MMTEKATATAQLHLPDRTVTIELDAYQLSRRGEGDLITAQILLVQPAVSHTAD